MPTATLLVLCGLPFAGKTTLARALRERLGCDVVSFDEVWWQSRDPQPTFESVLAEADARLDAALRAGRVAVFDSINHRRPMRDRWRAFAEERGARVLILDLRVPPNVVIARRRANALTSARHQVSDANFEKALAEHEPTSDDEPRLALDGAAGVEGWVAAVRAAFAG